MATDRLLYFERRISYAVPLAVFPEMPVYFHCGYPQVGASEISPNYPMEESVMPAPILSRWRRLHRAGYGLRQYLVFVGNHCDSLVSPVRAHCRTGIRAGDGNV